VDFLVQRSSKVSVERTPVEQLQRNTWGCQWVCWFLGAILVNPSQIWERVTDLKLWIWTQKQTAKYRQNETSRTMRRLWAGRCTERNCVNSVVMLQGNGGLGRKKHHTWCAHTRRSELSAVHSRWIQNGLTSHRNEKSAVGIIWLSKGRILMKGWNIPMSYQPWRRMDHEKPELGQLREWQRLRRCYNVNR
jgi:hypothetical protein